MKILFLVATFGSIIGFGSCIAGSGTMTFSGTIGTTGSWQLESTSYPDGSNIPLKLISLTADADYIIVTDDSTFFSGGNLTFTASSTSFELTHTFQMQPDNKIDLKLYGYNASTGFSSGNVIDSIQSRATLRRP